MADCEKTIMISGGTGLLGRELRLLDPSIIAPLRQECDITDPVQVDHVFDRFKPNIFIHCAAIVGTDECRQDPSTAMAVNIGGVLNTVQASIRYHCRFVFISTEYVFETCPPPGPNGYRETGPVGAVNMYARSKIAGEMVSAANPDHLIIRTSFVGREHIKYKGAFCDQYTNRDYVDVLAPHYYAAAQSDLTGVVHIGTNRKTQYELLKSEFPWIRPIQRKSINPSLAKDTTMDCRRWERSDWYPHDKLEFEKY